MPVCLVTAPTVAEFADPAEIRSESIQRAVKDPQLGVLSLAALLEAQDEGVCILDLNRTYLEYFNAATRSEVQEFAAFAASAVAANDAEVYGFSTICSSYPLTLRIAEAVKALRAQSLILLGGPQASVVDAQTLTAFSFVDFILRGEAEQTLPLLLDRLRGDHLYSQVPGLTYR